MNSKLAILVVIMAAILIGIGVAVVYFNISMPQTANIPSVTMEITVGGDPYTPETTIPWGTLDPGTSYYKEITIKNTGTLSCTITYQTLNLPSGWTETLTLGSTTLLPEATTTGTLTLDIPLSATPGNFEWTTIITATEAP